MLTGGIPDPASLPIDELIAATSGAAPRGDASRSSTAARRATTACASGWRKTSTAARASSLTAANFVLTCGSAGAFARRAHDVPRSRRRRHPRAAVLPGSTRVARSCLPEIAGVGVDDDGIIVDDLERVIARHRPRQAAEAALHDQQLPESGRGHDDARTAHRRSSTSAASTTSSSPRTTRTAASTSSASRCRRCSRSRAARARC